MADNYLEKKMEELRSGRLQHQNAPKRQVRGGLNYPFKPLRILFITGEYRFIKQYIAPLVTLGCRCAVISTIADTITDLGSQHGIRYYHTDTHRDPAEAFENLISAWRDIDAVIVTDIQSGLKLLPAIRRHIINLPYPNDWGTPIVVISDKRISRYNSDQENIARLSDEAATLTPISDNQHNENAAYPIPFILLRSSDRITDINIT